MTPLAHASDARRYGGKAAGLARLCATGLAVPPGYALTASEVSALASGTWPVEACWARLCRLPPVGDGADEARDADVFAVRSSAACEDGSRWSMAGQYATVLGVAEPAALVEAVAGLLQRRARSHAYADRAGIDASGPPGAVIQRLVRARLAGVAFTRNPLTGEPEILIEAAVGLGVTVADGRATPAGMRLRHTGAVLEQWQGDQRWALVYTGGRVQWQAVQSHEATIPPHVASAIVEAAPQLERVARGAADMEWAWDGHRLWFLQCRPITALPRSSGVRLDE